MEIKFKSQICTTVEQSKKLLELGLKPETADMCYSYKPKHLADTTPEEDWVLQIARPIGTDIPAWSLHRLIEIYSTSDEGCCVVNLDRTFDDIIDDIEWSINKGYFNKEYLKQ